MKYDPKLQSIVSIHRHFSSNGFKRLSHLHPQLHLFLVAGTMAAAVFTQEFDALAVKCKISEPMRKLLLKKVFIDTMDVSLIGGSENAERNFSIL